MFTEEEFKNFTVELRIYLGMHHELYDNTCKDVYLEELTSKAFKQIGFGSDWKPICSHSIGKDQKVKNDTRISNKSGMIIEDNGSVKIKISGSRTSRYATLGEKLNFLQKKEYDYLIGCGTNKEDRERKYYCYVLDSKKVDYFDLDWVEDLDKNGNPKYTGSGDGIVANIQSQSTSGQLWITIDKNFCDFFTTLNIDF